ncbi:MAG: gamma-glutamyltransferase family protein [Proteobacteria bacterium]|jgi:gamma-glutamyltranspeptidase / glutathione hydrolase|nr:gamma-glutamyltransferase family protein [Pseudomonadota bacterium]
MHSESILRTSIFVGLMLVIAACAEMPYDTIRDGQTTNSTQRPLRPSVAGRNAGVSAGHPLTTAAVVEILQKGGNAFDAGVAGLLVGGVVEQDLYSLGGEALVLVYPKAEGEVISITGQGWAPSAATIDYYLDRGKNVNGKGLDPAVIPGALHAALTVLEKWGTMSFEEVSARAIEYAEYGFPLRPRTTAAIELDIEFINQWSDNQRTWLKSDGTLYAAGETIRLPNLASMLKRMVEAEQNNKADGREMGIASARDRFYKGDIAREMVDFLQQHQSPFELADFAEFEARIETPTETTYRGYTVYKQPFNSQGPMLLQALNILENFDLQAMGHNSEDYVHTVIEALKLAYADRDTYYADQDFVSVPAAGLLSKEYARERAAQIDPTQSSTEFLAGDPLKYDADVNEWPYWVAGKDEQPMGSGLSLTQTDFPSSLKDTSHIAIIDKDGNVFDSTPSGGWIGGAVILGDTGIGMSVRGEQFWLDKRRAAQLRPRSRPRYTLTPSIVLKDGEPFLAIGTPGGDNQEQTILQTFLNIVEFWPDWYPNLHAAIEWPRVQTLHFYASFWPHDTGFNRINIENTMPPETIKALESWGHEVRQVPLFGISGCATAVMLDPLTGNRIAAADPRRDCYAIAY